MGKSVRLWKVYLKRMLPGHVRKAPWAKMIFLINALLILCALLYLHGPYMDRYVYQRSRGQETGTNGNGAQLQSNTSDESIYAGYGKYVHSKKISNQDSQEEVEMSVREDESGVIMTKGTFEGADKLNEINIQKSTNPVLDQPTDEKLLQAGKDKNLQVNQNQTEIPAQEVWNSEVKPKKDRSGETLDGELTYQAGDDITEDQDTEGQSMLSLMVSRYKAAHPYGTDPEDPDPAIHITSATEIQSGSLRWMPEDGEAFKTCVNLQPWMKCYYHMNATKEVLKKSHAVLFHVRNVYRPGHIKAYHNFPKIRTPDQKWIFYESEAPTNVWNYANRHAEYWKLFNITSTFTMDSDIPAQHHKVICTPKVNWTSSGINYAKGKTKLAAWFVSHCTSSSKRELYVEELSKYMSVDIFGLCGNSSVCQRHSLATADNEDCLLDFISKNYKFYFSFENAFCDHYVTEKFHRTVRRANVVPVVMGAADYNNILPKGSFINIKDFSSPKALAKHLLEIDKNDTLYNQYMENEKSMNCTHMPWFPCPLCEYLHHHRYETQRVYDAASFWSVKQRCTSPRDYFRGIADMIIPKIKFKERPDLFL